jgi:vitamin B12 transporter
MHFLKKAFFSFIFFTNSILLFAQDSTLQLENVIITATLTAQQQKESGRNIIAIKGEYFSKLPIHSVDELLRYLPGIEVQQRGPQGSQSDIVIRGGTFQQVLVIIDGVKLNDPLTGHFSMYVPVHPSEIEKIEILKGAASAIWGSEAVGGVVNIITKTFTTGKNKNEIKARAVAMLI